MTIPPRLRAQLSRDEGRIPHAYQDSRGYWTIGVGHLIDVRRGGRLPEHIIDALLDYDIETAARQVESVFLWLDRLDPVRQAVLVNMAFNLGLAGLLSFRRALAAMERGDWNEAAREMLDSRWARQVGARGDRLADQMRTGEWT